MLTVSQDLNDVIINIPLNIGAHDLKCLLFLACKVRFEKRFSGGYPVSLSSFTLRTKNWAEILPVDPDENAISSHWMKKGKGKAASGPLQFAASSTPMKIDLHFDNDYLEEVNEHLDKQELASRKAKERVSGSAFEMGAAHLLSQTGKDLVHLAVNPGDHGYQPPVDADQAGGDFTVRIALSLLALRANLPIQLFTLTKKRSRAEVSISLRRRDLQALTPTSRPCPTHVRVHHRLIAPRHLSSARRTRLSQGLRKDPPPLHLRQTTMIFAWPLRQMSALAMIFP
jgi:hypothetical protein